MLYPAPLGSIFGFKYTSILAFACAGNTKKYNIGSITITSNKETIIYFLFIPATYNINSNAIIYDIAVP